MPGAPAALWLMPSALLAASAGDPEALLRAAFARHGREDAFDHPNGISALSWAAHSCPSLVAIAASRSRRPDVLAVLAIGPALGVTLDLLGPSWSDPNWCVIVAACTIRWAVSTAVGGFDWPSNPATRPA